MTLGVILAVILLRSLRADLRRYNKEDRAPLVGTGEGLEDESAAEIDESGWKMVHGDAFRPPGHPGLLCALVASGAQLAVVGGFVFLFAYCGFLSPANRGSLAMAFLTIYALAGGVAGCVASRLYKALGGTKWTATTARAPRVVAFSMGAPAGSFLKTVRAPGRPSRQ